MNTLIRRFNSQRCLWHNSFGISHCVRRRCRQHEPSGTSKIEIKDFAFSPQKITVKSGDKITWINHDEEPHTVVSVGKKFQKSSALDTDQEFTITAGAPGTYEYFLFGSPEDDRNNRGREMSVAANQWIAAAVNAFDLKAAILARHAQHPVIVHFPIALFITSAVFEVLALWRKQPAFASVAYFNLLGAAISIPFTVATGLAAWQLQLEGATLKGNLRLHLVFALNYRDDHPDFVLETFSPAKRRTSRPASRISH